MADILTPIFPSPAAAVAADNFSPLTPASPPPPALPLDLPATQKALSEAQKIIAEAIAGNKLTALWDAVKAAPDLKAAAVEVESGFKTSEFSLVVAVLGLLGGLHVSGHDVGPALTASAAAATAIYTLARTWRKSAATTTATGAGTETATATVSKS